MTGAFSGEVGTGGSSRYFDDENEDQVDESVETEYVVEGELGEKEGNLLIVGDSHLGAAYTHLTCTTGMVAKMEIWGEGKKGSRQGLIARVFRSGQCTVVLVFQSTPHQDAARLAATLLDLVETTCQVITLTARHTSDLTLNGGEEADNCVRCLSTRSFTDLLPAPRLEQPNVLSGLPAALLSLAVVKGLSAALVVNYVDVMSVDSLSLEGFQAVFKLKKVKSALGVGNLPNIPAMLKTIRQRDTVASNLFM